MVDHVQFLEFFEHEELLMFKILNYLHMIGLSCLNYWVFNT